MKKIGLLFFLFLGFFSFKKNDVWYSNLKLPKQFERPVYDFTRNPITESKILLGRVLFYDPILSNNNTISCASCHSQYNAFAHIDHALSHGIDDKIGKRNAPALMNLAWQKSFMWDGAINHLDMQSLAPISNKDEMGETISNVVSKLNKSIKYRSLFYKAYKDSSATGEKLLKSISQFMLTLISANSKYDSVANNQAKFTSQEQSGYSLFKNYCASCHKEPLFTNSEFENNGLDIDTLLNDSGRMKVTNNRADYLTFKVPTLRNVEFTYPYMHDGRMKNLSDVIKHYSSDLSHKKFLSPKLNSSIVLSSNQRVDLIAFLLTLTDKEFLFNPNHGYPKEVLLK